MRSTALNVYYSFVINLENGLKRKVNFEQEATSGKGFIEGIDGYIFDKPIENTYNITRL